MQSNITTTVAVVLTFVLIFSAIYFISQNNVFWITILLIIYTVMQFISIVNVLSKRLSGKIEIWIDKDDLERYKKFGAVES